MQKLPELNRDLLCYVTLNFLDIFHLTILPFRRGTFQFINAAFYKYMTSKDMYFVSCITYCDKSSLNKQEPA